MAFRFDHFNFNVRDLTKSIEFYRDAFGFEPVAEEHDEAGSYRIVFLGDKQTGFRLELTWLRDRDNPYDLGDLEYHLAVIPDDYNAAHDKHREMGIICFENPEMGVYFVTDPDGYWIEILPS